MCKLKSAIVLKDRIFMPDYDSHSEMLSELGIRDDYLGASKKFVRVELSPVDGDVFSDIDSWRFNVDQDIRPEWFDEDTYLPLMRKKVKEWAKDRIHIGVDDLVITAGSNHYIKDCKNVTCENSTVTAWGNSTVTACENSTVTACENSTVTAWGNSTVTAWGSSTVTARENSTVTACENSTVTARRNSTVTAWGNSTVTAWGNSTVTAWGNSTVTAWGNSTVIKTNCSSFKKENLILSENATFKDCKAKIIYQSGGWKIVEVANNER